mgnify:CR=1 FL=1
MEIEGLYEGIDLSESLTRTAGLANRLGDHDAARRLARRIGT